MCNYVPASLFATSNCHGSWHDNVASTVFQYYYIMIHKYETWKHDSSHLHLVLSNYTLIRKPYGNAKCSVLVWDFLFCALRVWRDGHVMSSWEGHDFELCLNAPCTVLEKLNMYWYFQSYLLALTCCWKNEWSWWWFGPLWRLCHCTEAGGTFMVRHQYITSYIP